MSTITPPNITINGVSIAMQQYIEQRALNALLQVLQGTSSQEANSDLTQLRRDAAFDSGVLVTNIVP